MSNPPPSATDRDAENNTPTAVLSQVRALRQGARTTRHAYWFPLVVFGLLVCAAAPMYIDIRPVTSRGYLSSNVWLGVLGGNDTFGSPPDVRGWYWLCALVVGAVTTSLWYLWHARITGVATRARGSVLAWVLGPVGLLALVWVASYFLIPLWSLTSRGTSALLVIAAGLAVLSRVERSRALTAITIVYTFVACLSVFYNPENLLYTVYGWFGVESQNMPFDSASIVVPLMPGAVLLLCGLAALVQDLRKR